MYDFTNKYICLVLTCNKPEYKERIDKHQYIYSKINSAGFEIVFLYANPNISDYEIIQDENGYYKLTVPTEETYENLSTKMFLAYSFFSKIVIKGILKVDDDIYYIDDLALDLDYYEADYLGADKGYLMIYSKYISHPLYDNNIENCTYYFGGPFYWVSNKAIKYIANSIWPYREIGTEDIFVGISLADKHDIKRYVTNWKSFGYVKYLDGIQL